MSALLMKLLPLFAGFFSNASAINDGGREEGDPAKEAALVKEAEAFIRRFAETVERTTGKRITLGEAHDVAEDAEDRILRR